MTLRTLSLATWNVNSLKVRLPHLEQWLSTAGVDALGLQETKVTDGDFPGAEIERLGLTGAWHGQRTYNGVALLARAGVFDIVRGIPGFADEQARVIAGTIQGVRVVDVYVPNGQSVGSDKYLYKLRWLEGLRAYLVDAIAGHEYLAVIGDYNIAPEDRDVHDPKAWEGQVHVSEEERAALGRLRDLGLVDVFRRFPQAERTFSWWDYRAAAFRRNAGLRIDLILASPRLAERCTACRVDRDTRRWERPSDHAPVVATFDLS
ncbi:MAG TPA: exodeoxyribonuclease III, partial [Steroidobacteraceae bacterium]|nr:exodeoxyribonuclease III [Steroidobacteraceae bacterium]